MTRNSAEFNADFWGNLADRYRPERPRKLLALDGGGIRGLVTLKILERLEHLLRDRSENPEQFRLCDFFDYIGGTSTGAIIAAGLATGMRVDELLAFYENVGPEIFSRRVAVWESLYGDGPLRKQLQSVFGNATLEPRHLRTLLLVVTRNKTTDSAWPLCSNPQAQFNDPLRTDCNLRVPLWQVVRASAAAPVYFPPEVVRLGQQEFVFVDGGTTAYNNPAFLLYRMATAPEYRLGWRRGERHLLLVSVGTGLRPQLGQTPDEGHWIGGDANNLLLSLITQASFDQDLACRTVGRCTAGPRLDSEVGDLIPRGVAGEPLPLSQDLGRSFTYVRYDPELTRDGLDALGLHDIEPTEVSSLDAVDRMGELKRIGVAAGKVQVRLEQLGDFVG